MRASRAVSQPRILSRVTAAPGAVGGVTRGLTCLEVSGVRSPFGARVPRQGGGLLRGQGRSRRRRAAASPTAQFGERTHRLANALVELGVEAGDRVAFITYNTHQLLEAYYGVLEAGAVLNPINIRLTPSEIAYILGHAGSKVVFFHKDFKPLVEALDRRSCRTRPRFVIMEGEPGGIATDEYEALLAGGSPDPLTRRSTRTPLPSSSTRAARPASPRASR